MLLHTHTKIPPTSSILPATIIPLRPLLLAGISVVRVAESPLAPSDLTPSVRSSPEGEGAYRHPRTVPSLLTPHGREPPSPPFPSLPSALYFSPRQHF